MPRDVKKQFGETYAGLYDLIYAHKDYEGECRYINSLIKKYQDDLHTTSIVDIACGTGGHAIPLARMGFRMTAQDISGAMVSIGQSKASKLGLDIRWRGRVAMQRFSSEHKYDGQ